MAAAPVAADTIRVATFTVELDRKGPGLLLRDIQSDKNKQVRAVIAQIVAAQPDVIAIQRFDWDARLDALTAFQNALDVAGWPLPHAVAPRPNSGVPSGLDLNNNGRTTDDQDNFGYGRFPGNRGLVVLSRLPITHADVRDFTALPSALNAQLKMHTVAYVEVPIMIGDTQITILASHATAPLFDGGTGQNARRNAEEVGFFDTRMGQISGPFVIAANLNLDVADGDGDHAVIQQLLANPALQDPQPTSKGAALAADADHTGNPALDTADWPDGMPGNLRVSYVLPSKDLRVLDSAVQWDPGQDITASKHRLVWVDIAVP